MDSHTKVMTVSYGTFSCTLEGFDDPFTTMQLVAEYFRKLAAEDRYFGGDPLQPDANKLHQIAKDANPNKVDAEINENGILLRQADIVDAPVQKPVEKNPETAPAETPAFASKRRAPAPAQKAAVSASPAPAAKPAAKVVPSEDSYVEAAVFSSRRGALEPAAGESAKPAAELLREAEAPVTPVAKPAEKPVTAKAPAKQVETSDRDVQDAVRVVAEKIETPSEPAPKSPDESPAKVAAEIARDLVKEPEPAPKAEEKPEVLHPTPIKAPRDANDIQREEEALERLLETTNSKLSTPAHARRSNALERLKAAVAATEAERRLRGGAAVSRPKLQDLNAEPDAFRQEMKSVRTAHEEEMKITRPVLKRPSKTRRASNIATLVLGTEQRVADEDADTTALKKKAHDRLNQPPRSIPDLAVLPDPERAGGFVEFAHRAGASSLLELLEASAAYLAIVEQQNRFSQDLMVSNVGEVLDAAALSDDAASRSLNRLLRDGKILRVTKDTFTISKSTRHGYLDRTA